MAIKMVVSDMDGTLLDKNFRISQESREIIRAIQSKGIIFTIASGRLHRMMNQYYNDLDMYNYKNGYMIGLNGIELYSFKENILKKYVSFNNTDSLVIARSILEISLIPILMYDEKTIIIKDDHEMEAMILSDILNNKYSGAFPDVKLEFLKDINFESVNKFCVLNTKNDMKTIIKKLNQKIENENIKILMVGGEWIEIVPSNIDKANRLQEIMHKENINKDEVIVFGDSQNDIEMLEFIPNSYAMENATEEVKKHAHYIADSHDKNGVAKILKKLLL